MHLQNLLPPLHIGQVNVDFAVKPSGAQKSGIKNIFPIGRCDNDHPLSRIDPIHFDQECIEGLLPLVVTAPQTVPPTPADGINFVDKDQAGRGLLPLLKHVPDPGGTHPDKHLHKIRTTDAVKRNVSLAGNGFGQECFSGSRRSHHQDTLGNSSAQFLKLFRIPEKLHDLAYLVLGLLHPRHIGESHLVAILGKNSCLALAKAKG